MPHCLMSNGQRAPRQDGIPRHDNPCRQTNGLGILHYLCPEGKWWAMSVLGSPWPQWGHLPWSSQDAHSGGSHSWVCTLSLLHQVGQPSWLLVNHPQPGLQPAYDFQQSFWKIPFPVTPLWPGLRWIRSLKNAKDILESQMTSPYTAALRQNMMPTYKIFMETACKYDLVFNPQKMQMKAQAINFFACLYDANGVHPDLGKVNAVHALPAPTNITELQEFLGLVTYQSPFIPGLSTLTALLQELLKKDTDFIWNHTYDATFEWVKEAVISDTTLRYFDPSPRVTIQVDASQVGLGAALLQNDKPIAFASKALTKTECQYVNIERDASCCLWSREIPHLHLWTFLHDWIRPQATWIHLP